MPKKAPELSDLAVRRLSEPGIHFVGGVPGLAIQVLPGGGKTWILRATVGAKRRDMGLGGYPTVSLSDARDAARAARAKIRLGLDPIEERRSERRMLELAQANAVTFENAASSYIAIHEPGWHNAKHAQQWRNSLATHAHPLIGSRIVREIDVHDVLRVLEPIWLTKTETATRVRSRIENILDWAKTRGYREGDNPARWKGHLQNLLPKPSKVAKEKHFPALPFGMVGDFMSALRKLSGVGAKALEFAILTTVRSGEARGARWGEFDLKAAEWKIPATRMKMKVEHRVPLSPAALSILQEMADLAKQSSGSDELEASNLVFPAPRGGELSNGTLNAVIQRMNQPRAIWVEDGTGREVVQHGFRSTFKDWASECTAYPREVSEMALAHGIDDKVEAAYRRGDLFEKRRQLMDDWANYCNGA
jgi:integrase